MTTQPSDFYSDLKWCDACQDYRRYLMSMEHSYCIDCGCKVRLFNNQDWAQFNDTIKERKPKGGRPRKKNHEAEPA